MKRGVGTLQRDGLRPVAAIVVASAVFLLVFSTVFSAVFTSSFGSPAASPAYAAPAQLVSTIPADGSKIENSPTAITVTFDQSIGSNASAIISCNGNPVPRAPVNLSEDLLSMVVDLSTTVLPRGACQVLWSVLPIGESTAFSGNFEFTIEGDAAATTTAVTTAPADATATSAPAATSGTESSADSADDGEPTDLSGPLFLTRLVSMLTIAILFGSIVLITVAWPEGVEYVLTIRFIRLTWIVALVSTAAMVACMRAEATGESFTSSLMPTSWTDLTDTTPGLAVLARVLFVAAVGWVALRPDRAIDPTTQLPALLLPALAVVTMGFSRSGGDLAWLGHLAGIGHALAMAIWFGGLVLLVRVVLAGPGDDDLVHAVRGFGRLATPAMVVTVLTGVIQLYRLDGGHLTDTTHGKLMMFKVLPVLGMVVIGTATRQFVNARMSRAEAMTMPLANRLRRAVGFEAMLGVAILAITSWMLSAQPGNLVAGPISSDDFAGQLALTNADSTLDVKVSLDPAREGENEMLLEIFQPVSDIVTITLTFTPPASATTAQTVSLTITEVRGAGAVHIDRSVGVPLRGVGPWTVAVDITLANGTVLTQNGLVNVRSDGTSTGVVIPSVESTPVTAAPTSTTIPVTVAAG